jgi:isochorismate hydrolase
LKQAKQSSSSTKDITTIIWCACNVVELKNFMITKSNIDKQMWLHDLALRYADIRWHFTLSAQKTIVHIAPRVR